MRLPTRVCHSNRLLHDGAWLHPSSPERPPWPHSKSRSNDVAWLLCFQSRSRRRFGHGRPLALRRAKLPPSSIARGRLLLLNLSWVNRASRRRPIGRSPARCYPQFLCGLWRAYLRISLPLAGPGSPLVSSPATSPVSGSFAFAVECHPQFSLPLAGTRRASHAFAPNVDAAPHFDLSLVDAWPLSSFPPSVPRRAATATSPSSTFDPLLDVLQAALRAAGSVLPAARQSRDNRSTPTPANTFVPNSPLTPNSAPTNRPLQLTKAGQPQLDPLVGRGVPSGARHLPAPPPTLILIVRPLQLNGGTLGGRRKRYG